MTREGVECFWVLTAAALNVFVLYAPQPLLPLFGGLYGVNEPTAGLIMTATMLPLAIAPLSYGYLLGYVQALGLLRVSLLLLAILAAVTGLVQNFSQMLIVRFLQGMIIPASLTAVMAFLAQPGKNLQRGMSLYVAATISGGFLGRLLAGVSSAFINWQTFFYLLAALLALCYYMIGSQQVTTRNSQSAPSAGRLSSLKAVKSCLPVYLAIFLLFFVFCGTLNYLPFRTMELAGSRSGLLAGVMYFGYVTGIATSMGAGRFINMAGSPARVMIGGYLLFGAALLGMLFHGTLSLFILLFPFCGAMFLVHCVATAVVNSRAEGNRGAASAVYVSSYYSGGVAGSYFPGLVFNAHGWESMVAFLACFCLLGTLLLAIYFRSNVSG